MTGSMKCAPIMRMAPKANTESHQTSLSARRNENLVADGRLRSGRFGRQNCIDRHMRSQKRDNLEYAKVGDADKKALLTFPDITREIDADMNLQNGVLDPERFAALNYALCFSKLALLDRSGLRKLVYRFGGDAAKVPEGEGSHWTVLTSSLRSIEGNHQWQPFGIPYARTDQRSRDAGQST